MSVASENFNLPPKVSGRDRGYLNFAIERIHWKTIKTFGDVKIRLLWWGQSEGISCEGIKININKAKVPEEPLKTIRYQIKTNHRLFVSYLKNCEPIKLEVYSSKTRDFIGFSNIEVPLKFHIQDKAEQSCRVTAPILSSRQFSLGEVVISMNIHQLETMTPRMTHKNSSSLKEAKTDELEVLKEKDSNKENIEVVGRKKRISFRDPKPLKRSTLNRNQRKENAKPIKSVRKNPTFHEPLSAPAAPLPPPNDLQSVVKPSVEATEKSTLINYLSGEPMSRVDESNFLHNLATISPSESVIEGLNKPARTEATTRDLERTKIQLADKINSIKITISQVEFNAAGQLETQNFMNKNRLQKCILKCVVTSKCFKANEDVKMISPVFETAPKRVPFTREMMQRIVMPVKRDNTHVFINFGFCVKPIDQQTSTFFVGFSRVNLLEVINSKSSFHKKCPIISESDLKVGTLNVKMELGINELHFGRDLIDSIYGRRENISVCSDDNSWTERIEQCKPVKLVKQKVQTKTHPSHSNDQCDNERNYENKNVQTDKTSIGSHQHIANAADRLDERDAEMIDVAKADNQLKSKVYSGLLFLGSLRNIKDASPAEYFITYEGFWNECQESTESSVNSLFNYLKQFPVICDDIFLKRVQNNHLELKLWEKTERSEKWIGSTKVPLHQFFIAFRDATMIQHLSTNPLPVISIDNWSNFNSPLSSELFCQGKVLLAIGTESQVDYLKLLRNLHNLHPPARRESVAVQVDQSKPRDLPDPNVQMKNKLSAFIESLSQKLPEPSISNNLYKTSSAASSASSKSKSEPQQLRKTSDLLESLQKALSQPPTSNLSTVNQNHQSVTSDSSMSSVSPERVKMLVTIEHANHLPKVVVKKKQHRRKNKNLTPPQKLEFDPSTYATFESCLEQVSESSIPANVVKSYEGFVHCTKVVKSCDPEWDEQLEVQMPLDVLTNPQKRFVVKVWRKVSQDSEMRPAPFEDAVIGFSAVDLSVLLTGLPILSGYYNIMDFSGRCNGQIKLSLKPMENLVQYQDSSTSLPVAHSLMNPLNIDVGNSEEGSSNLLSRTLKRKFTELDEITQRLKARLFDVTGDENFDPDEEFERDLNTAVDDMEDDTNEQNDFAWLKNDSNGNAPNNFESQLKKILETQPSTSKNIPGCSTTETRNREVSGCSNSQPMAIDQLLKKYDLDTLINPSIFKNILDPTLAHSDSTPTLNPQRINTNDLADASGDSGDTTVSSILSNDQVQTIEKALQKTSLASDKSSSRKDPDGENNISE